MASVPGTIFSTFAQNEALKTQNEIRKQQAEINKEIGEFNAKEAVERGKENEKIFRKQVKKVIGSQRAAIAASNIELSSGSALELQEEAAAIGEADALQIRQNARMEAFGFKIAALNVETQGRIDQATNKAQRASTLLAGGINTTAGIGAFALGGGFKGLGGFSSFQGGSGTGGGRGTPSITKD